MQPEQIGPWRIDGELGSGGMGTVYHGFHDETGQEAAVKVLPASLAREPGFISRFNREITAMQRLRNPHIVEFFESGECDDGTYYYAMEIVHGETLTSRIKRQRRLPWREVIDLTVQICAALKAAHDHGIIHRDLKPSNLLINTSDQVKLTDFGVAHVFAGTKLTRTGGVIGTAEYMSPEQSAGKRVSKTSDLYSLGAVMYVMLTGRPPFTGKNTIEIVRQHQYGQFDLPQRYVPDIPSALQAVVCELLDKDPLRRPPDAYVLSRRLSQVTAHFDYSQKEQNTATLGSDLPQVAEVTIQAAGQTTDPETDVNEFASGPGPATLMRDLMRAEIDRAQAPTAIGAFFNNIWVLLTMLALVVAGGFFLIRSPDDRPRQIVEQANALLESDPGPDWLKARDLLLSIRGVYGDEWDRLIAPDLDRIRRFVSVEKLHRELSTSMTETSEPERILRDCKRLIDQGEIQSAISKLTSMIAMIEGDTDFAHEYSIAVRYRDDLTARIAEDTGLTRFLESRLEFAQTHVENGQAEAARQVCRAALDSYREYRGMHPCLNSIAQLLADLDGAETAAPAEQNPVDEQTDRRVTAEADSVDVAPE